MWNGLPPFVHEPLWRTKLRLVRWLHRHGQAESFEVMLAEQLKSLHISHVLDVGANRGQFARHLRRLGYGGKIVSFEPVAECYAQILRDSRGSPDWEVHNLGLGDVNEVRQINVSRLDVLSSILQPSAASQQLLPGEGDVLRTESITVRRLSDLLPQIVPDGHWATTHLKLDTQGFDLNVLRGLGEAIGTLQSLQSELSVVAIYEGQPDYVTSLAFLRDQGFVPTCIYPVQRTGGGRVLEFDALFVRATA